MHPRILLPFLILLACTATAGAQDTHFTLHDYQPLWLNPAHTGAYSGSVRVGGIYRGQWYTLDGIRTPSGYVDAPIVRGLRKTDWIGVGALLINDNAGGDELGFQRNYFGFSAAYHLSLDDRRRNVLTLGAQYGSNTYSLDVGSADLTQQLTIDTGLGGGGLMQGELQPNSEGSGNEKSYSDISAGVMLRSVLDPKKDNLFEVGATLLHLNTPDRESLLSPSRDTTGGGGIDTSMIDNEDNLRRRATLHLHSRLDLEVNDKWRFQPSVLLQSSAAVTIVSLQAWGARRLNANTSLRLGLGYRTGDSAQVLVGLDRDRLRAALSYDIALSQSRTVTNFQNSFEVSAAYIFNIYKKPSVVPTMLCPRL